MEKYTKFYNQILENKCLALEYLLPNFYDIFGNYGELYDGYCIKIYLRFASGIPELWWKFQGHWLPPKFSASRSGETAFNAQ